MNDSECRTVNTGMTIDMTMVCAGGQGAGTCQVAPGPPSHHHSAQGDSGGPLTVNGTLVGVVSHGSAHCDKVRS